MAVGGHLVLAAQGELPADVRLELERLPAPGEGHLVQGAAGTGGEIRSVQEDAGTIHQPGHRLAVRFFLTTPFLALPVVLPLVDGEGPGHPLDPASSALSTKWAP